MAAGELNEQAEKKKEKTVDLTFASPGTVDPTDQPRLPNRNLETQAQRYIGNTGKML